MSDTQWPRFEVFKQDNPDKPHQAVGSVHAPDGETALLMARDVFVRRPKCVSLWVAPAGAILSRTQQELENKPMVLEQEDPAGDPQPYHIFRKSSQRRAMTFVDWLGEIAAPSPAQALQQAIAQFSDEPAFVWWVVPETALFRSQDEEIDSLFAPALDKSYRHQSAYGTVAPSRQRG